MRERISQAVFSGSGVSLAVGAAGFLSAIVTMFINTSLQVSIKWLLLLAWIFLTIAIILVKLIFNLSNEKAPPPPFEVPIRYLRDDRILLIRRNDNFTNQIVVGCYSIVDDVERLIFLGSVHHVQDKFIQIRVIQNGDNIDFHDNQISDIKVDYRPACRASLGNRIPQ